MEHVALVVQSLKEAKDHNAKAMQGLGPSPEIAKKMCLSFLWNVSNYEQYLSGLTNVRHILDMNAYLSLMKEGNDAIRQKESPSVEAGSKDGCKRSHHFNRDYYRMCVAEGLQAISYQFMLLLFWVGIKLEEIVMTGSFNYEKILQGKEEENDPLKWVALVILDMQPKHLSQKGQSL